MPTRPVARGEVKLACNEQHGVTIVRHGGGRDGEELEGREGLFERAVGEVCDARVVRGGFEVHGDGGE